MNKLKYIAKEELDFETVKTPYPPLERKTCFLQLQYDGFKEEKQSIFELVRRWLRWVFRSFLLHE